MASFDREPESAWDEYDWERFLQQQDQKTEHYMELLEKYLDDPRRDEIIAQEMGWTHLLDSKDWSAEVGALMDKSDHDDESAFVDDGGAESESTLESFENHSLYRAAFSLTIWIDELFDRNVSLQNE